MSKFEQPLPTKSGKSAMILWKELKSAWRKYKLAQSQSDLIKMRECANMITSIQDDLGIKTGNFPELKEEKIHT